MTTCINLKYIMLSEGGQLEKCTYNIILLIAISRIAKIIYSDSKWIRGCLCLKEELEFKCTAG